MKKYIIVLFSVLISGCVLYPKVSSEQNPPCQLQTKKLDMGAWALDVNNINDPRGVVGLLAAGASLAVVTGVISGSIIIAGNAIHWIEKEGTCDDGSIKNATNNLSDSLHSLGGLFVTSVEQIYDWLAGGENPEENKNN